MEVVGKKHLEKLKRKNKGNIPLINAIDTLLRDLEENDWKNEYANRFKTTTS